MVPPRLPVGFWFVGEAACFQLAATELCVVVEKLVSYLSSLYGGGPYGLRSVLCYYQQIRLTCLKPPGTAETEPGGIIRHE